MLGSVPLAVYLLTYLPILFYHKGSVGPGGIVAWHREMVRLQGSVAVAAA